MSLSRNMLIISLLSFATLTAHAGQKEYIEECREAAITKLEYKADNRGLEFNHDDVEVSYIDDRWYNPSKYVWFKVMACDDDDCIQLGTLTQKSYLPEVDCF